VFVLFECGYSRTRWKLKINPTVNINELTKKAAVIPAASKRKMPINGPGTVAILKTELVIPSIPPCSSAEVRKENWVRLCALRHYLKRLFRVIKARLQI